MKLIHLSDLHLGKRLDEFSLLEDQKYILIEIINIIREEKPEAVIIAGDVYDKAVPSAEAVQLFDNFLVRLSELGQEVFVISGNHDSPERISFASRLIERSGVHLSPVYDGSVKSVPMEDAYGKVNFWMLPFLKPVHVRRWYPDEEIKSYTDAVRLAVKNMEINSEERNVLITHQFVTGAQQSGSEEASIGGLDNVDASVFDAFDYVALGHIHGAQNVGTERIRYCGTPLKYSFSEAAQEKSVTVVTLNEKGDLGIRTVPLAPKHDLRELRGTYEELTFRPNYEGTKTDDYLRITLTDEEDVPNAIGNLRVIYPNLMKLLYDNRRTRANEQISGAEEAENKSPVDLFAELYEKQNGQPMSDEQREYAEKLTEKILEEYR